MSGSISVRVDTHGLQDRLAVLKDREVKTAIRRAVSKAGTRGRTIARANAPVKTGAGRAGISKTSTRGGDTARCTIFLGGPHAHIMNWQDQGTGDRHTKRSHADRGTVEPQHFMERAATDLEGWLPIITDAEITAAIARSGL
jgi:hypothetical protein